MKHGHPPPPPPAGGGGGGGVSGLNLGFKGKSEKNLGFNEKSRKTWDLVSRPQAGNLNCLLPNSAENVFFAIKIDVLECKIIKIFRLRRAKSIKTE